MISPKLNGTKVVIGPCRLSYVHLLEKYAPDGVSDDNAKYMTNILIPKNEKETINAINKAIAQTQQEGVVSKWGGKMPKKEIYNPLRDGDEKEDELYEDHFFLNAKASTRPGVVDRNRVPIMDEEEVYSGMWAIISITFFPYNFNGKPGIGCGLNNVMKFKDDIRLGGRASADTDFAEIDIDDEDL